MCSIARSSTDAGARFWHACCNKFTRCAVSSALCQKRKRRSSGKGVLLQRVIAPNRRLVTAVRERASVQCLAPTCHCAQSARADRPPSTVFPPFRPGISFVASGFGKWCITAAAEARAVGSAQDNVLRCFPQFKYSVMDEKRRNCVWSFISL